MQVIIEQILILSIIGLIGLAAIKTKLINRETVDGLVKIILKITLPLLIFTTFAGTKIDNEIFTSFLFVFAAPFVCVPVLFFLGSFSAKIQKLNKENTALHRTSTMFGNVAFLGFPLLNALFPGGEGLIYATVFQLSHDAIMWTWGILILNNGSEQKSSKTWTHIINPTTIAFVIGVFFLVLKIEIPEIIFIPLHGLGHTTIYLSMIYVGAILANVNAKSLITNYRSYIVSFNKLLLGPAVLMLCFYFLHSAGINISIKAMTCAILQGGMPCMIIVSVLAKELGLNARQSVENIFISSVLSIFTLPFMYYLTTLLFK
jgi:predicted permease